MDPSPGPPLLRTRRGLMFTALPAIAVLAALGVLLAVAHHDSVVQDRKDETASLANAAAVNARRFVDDQFAVLSAIAAAPSVRSHELPVVRPYVQSVARSAGFTRGVGLLDRGGKLVTATRPVALGDREYVRTALEQGRPGVSGVLLDRGDGRPVLSFSYPVSAPAGGRNGAVVGSVRLDQIDAVLTRLLYAPGAGETLIDTAGHVIVGQTAVHGLVAAPPALPVRMMRARRSGVIGGLSTPVGKRLVGYATVPGTGWLVVVDQDHGAIIGPLDNALAAEIVALALLALLGVVATLAGARRLDRLDAERDAALAEQRDIAVRLQRSLLPDVPSPDRVDVHASYAPAQGAMAIGGDWYDVVEVSDGRVAMSVGDVAGHGLGAASVMGQLRSAGRTLALEDAAPADVLRRLDHFASTLDGRPLATVVFALLDCETGALRYAVAGYPPPLVVRADGSTELLLDGRSPLLGVDPGDGRPEGEAQLAPGDTLIFYTDGLVEQPDSSIDAGIDRLVARAAGAAAQSPRALADALIAAVPEPRRDDTAVLCVRLAPSGDQPSSVAS